jgi:hypothetical protein
VDRGTDSVVLDGLVDGNMLVIKYKIELNDNVPIFIENEGEG